MRNYLVIIFVLLAFSGCAKRHDIIIPPGQIDARMGPSHQRIKINSARGRRLFEIELDKDGQDITLKRDQEQRIIIQRK